MIKAEFKKIFRQKLFWLSVLLGTASGLLGLISYYEHASWYVAAGNEHEISAYQAWLNCLSLGSTIYRIVAPLLIAPIIDGLFVEVKSGYANFVLSRASHREFFVTKYIVGLLSASMILVLSLLLMLAVCMCLFPLNPPVESSTYLSAGFMTETFLKTPFAYIGLMLASNVLFAVLYYSFGFGMTMFTKNRYVLMLTPFLVYMVLTIIGDVLCIPALMPVVYIAPHELTGLTMRDYLAFTATMVIISASLVGYNYHRFKREVI